MRKIYKLLFIYIAFIIIISVNLRADDLSEEIFYFDTENPGIKKNIENAPMSIKIKVLINQFNQYDDIESRTDAIFNAGKLGSESIDFFNYIYNKSQNPIIKIEALKSIYKYKLNFKEIILDAVNNNVNDSIIILGIECAVNLNDTDRLILIENCFSRKNNVFYISHLLPILFLNPENNKNFIRRILMHDDLELRMSCYKYLVNSAPKLFELTCLGMFDENPFINRFILSKYKLYGDNNGKQLLYYGLNSSDKTVSDYAKTLLTTNY
ncbi:hypothetical protein KA977_00940 [Candidatus Dependentiae bacterium]|nr:hypothetical protein [Candidatus Dependentiae bacterium]